MASSGREEVATVGTPSRGAVRDDAGIPLRDQAACRVDDECAVTFVRTNETRSRGVSDPLGAGLRAKSGAAETGSLTPRLPRLRPRRLLPAPRAAKTAARSSCEQPPRFNDLPRISRGTPPRSDATRPNPPRPPRRGGTVLPRFRSPTPFPHSRTLMPSQPGRRDGGSRGSTSASSLGRVRAQERPREPATPCREKAIAVLLPEPIQGPESRRVEARCARANRAQSSGGDPSSTLRCWLKNQRSSSTSSRRRGVAAPARSAASNAGTSSARCRGISKRISHVGSARRSSTWRWRNARKSTGAGRFTR